MKYKIILFFVFFYVGISVFSQNQKPEKQIWLVDSVGKLYINKNLPVYLWLSTSPDENSKKYKLEGIKDDKYTNPMYFDTEGKNTVHSPWAVDKETKKVKMPKEQITFEVWADGLAPSTKSKLFGAKKYVKSGTTYYSKNLKLTLTPFDAVSGIKEILLSINSAAYTNYNGDTDIDKEGNTTIKYYSTDELGNVEGSHSKSFVVDITPPEITQTITGPKKGNVLGPKTKFVISSSDNLSGVKYLYYAIDGVKKLYTTPIPLKNLLKGSHKLSIYAVDYVGNSNIENKRIMNFDFDNASPELIADVIGDQYKGKYLYVSERSKIKLTATDETGTNEVTYGIDAAANNKYSDPFLLNKKRGLQNVNFKAVDNVDNISVVHKKTVFLDNKKPLTGITYKRPQFFNRDTLFINSKTNVQLFASDKDAGIKITEYSVGDNTNFQAYNGEFKLGKDGSVKIFFKSTDNVNNTERIKESECCVDNTSPEIYVKYSINPIGKETKDGKTYDAYPQYTKIYIAATDKWCGTETIYYSINGSAKALYTSAQAFQQKKLINKKGVYTITVTAVDKLGNTGELTESFIKY